MLEFPMNPWMMRFGFQKTNSCLKYMLRITIHLAIIVSLKILCNFIMTS